MGHVWFVITNCKHSLHMVSAHVHGHCAHLHIPILLNKFDTSFLGPAGNFDTKPSFLDGLGAEIFQSVTQSVSQLGTFTLLGQTCNLAIK